MIPGQSVWVRLVVNDFDGHGMAGVPIRARPEDPSTVKLTVGATPWSEGQMMTTGQDGSIVIKVTLADSATAPPPRTLAVRFSAELQPRRSLTCELHIEASAQS